MSEINDTHQEIPLQDKQKDLVGDTLRKERITRRITVDTIAKDLKLNVKYIKALESNDYEALPADPYVRVYLKSLAKYLTLDSDAILKQFYRERGLSSEHAPGENTERITISVKRKEESRSPLLIIATILIILAALFSFIAKKQGWIDTSPAPVPAISPQDPEFTDTTPETDSTLADSLIPVTPPPAEDTAADAAQKKVADVAVDTTNMMHFQLSVIKDSVWIQVYSDGESWKNVIRKGRHRQFAARDSFNVHVGNLSAVRFALNSKAVKVYGKGVVAFKIDRSGKPVKWTLSKWNSVFKDRN